MLTVRAAMPSDMPQLAALEKAFFSDAWSESMLSDCLLQSHYAVNVCADEDEKIVGYLISTHVAGEAELLRIGVEAARRRQGIGRILMETFVRLCAEQETPDAFLEVRESNRSAISLYEHFCFENVGRRKKYYHHPDEDAVLMAGTMTN